jgi:hypothetical protein
MPSNFSKIFVSLLVFFVSSFFQVGKAQTIHFEGREFSLSHVKASVVPLNGEEVLRIERDLNSLPFDPNRMGSTVDEATFVKVNGLDLDNTVIEVEVLSRLLPNAPTLARGFIGIAFRIHPNQSAFESIYLRPTNGRADDQFRRNHTLQYFSYPDYKFDKLRATTKGEYETYADIGLDEWIRMKIVVKDRSATLYLNDQLAPAFLVKELLGSTTFGSIGLWVDIGTEGFFKNLKISSLED